MLCPPSLLVRMARAPRFRGNYLRMALLRFRYAYIIVAVLRSTALRRVVDGLPGRHRHPHGETSSSLHPDVNTVRPHPSGSGRSVLTSGPRPTAHEQSGAAPLVRRGQKAVRRSFAREVDRPFHITGWVRQLRRTGENRREKTLFRPRGLRVRPGFALTAKVELFAPYRGTVDAA